MDSRGYEFLANLKRFSRVLFVGTTILAALHCWRTRGGNSELTYIGA